MVSLVKISSEVPLLPSSSNTQPEQAIQPVPQKKIKNEKSEKEGASDILKVKDLLASNTYQHIYRLVEDNMKDIDFSPKIVEDTETEQLFFSNKHVSPHIVYLSKIHQK